MTTTTDPDYGEAGEARLRAFVESTTGGRVTRMERQSRWRPAWFLDVECCGETMHLHLRGDREGDVSIFPELKREADVMEVLAEHGIPVPRIYGYCSEPPAILMQALRGSRNLALAASDEERRAICREFIATVVAMHKLPVEPFVARGLHRPEGGAAIVLAGLDAYLPLYERTRRKPEPFLTFMLGWLRRNVPLHRDRPAFIQYDSGQFLFEDGRMTGMYDFEFSMIGDPMTDLATMRMRNSVEPLGDSMVNICKAYEEFSGEPVDHRVIEYHSLLFATISTMQFAGTVHEPVPGDPHSVYLEFDLALRQVMLHSLVALTGLVLPPEPPLATRPGPNAGLVAKISDTLGRVVPASDIEAARQDSAMQLVEWLDRADRFGDEVRARNLRDVSALLGRPFEDWTEAEAALDAHVAAADAGQDERLFALFAAIEARQMLMFGPTRIGRAAMGVHLPPTR